MRGDADELPEQSAGLVQHRHREPHLLRHVHHAHRHDLIRIGDVNGCPLAVLQGQGFRVALVTDGRMSGASGKVPAAIHVSPEAVAGGPLARLRNGDIVRLDAEAGTLQALVAPEEWAVREAAVMPEALRLSNGRGMGRELFSVFRRNALAAEQGACTWL